MLQEKCAVTFPQDMRIEEKCCLFLAFLSAPLQNLLTEIGIGYNFTLIFTLIKCTNCTIHFSHGCYFKFDTNENKDVRITFGVKLNME